MADDWEYDNPPDPDTSPGQHGRNFNAPYRGVVIDTPPSGSLAAIRQAIRVAHARQIRQAAERRAGLAGTLEDVAGPPMSPMHEAGRRLAHLGGLIAEGIPRGIADTLDMAALGPAQRAAIEIDPTADPEARRQAEAGNPALHITDAIGLTHSDYTPPDTASQAILEGSRFLGGGVVPEIAIYRLGTRVAARVAAGASEANLSRAERIALSYVRQPGRTAAANVTGAAGSVAGGHAAAAINPALAPVGQLIGGLAGGAVPFIRTPHAPEGHVPEGSGIESPPPLPSEVPSTTSSPSYQVLYHGGPAISSRDDIANIRSPSIYLTDSLEEAQIYADRSGGVVSKIRLHDGPFMSSEDLSQVRPIGDAFGESSHRTSEQEAAEAMKQGGVARIPGDNISGNQTTHYVVWDRNRLSPHGDEPPVVEPVVPPRAANDGVTDPVAVARDQAIREHAQAHDLTPAETAEMYWTNENPTLTASIRDRTNEIHQESVVASHGEPELPLVPPAQRSAEEFAARRNTALPEASNENAAPGVETPAHELPLGDQIDPEADYRAGHQPEDDTIPSEPAKPAPQRAGNINLDRLVAPDDVKATIRAIQPESGTPSESHAQTVARAEELVDEHGPEGLLSLETVRPEDIVAYTHAVRAVNVEAARRLSSAVDAVLDPALNNPESQEAFLRARVLAAAANDKATGVTSIAGRLLNSMKISVGDGPMSAKVRAALESAGNNGVDPAELAAAIRQHANDPAAVGRLASASFRRGAGKYIFSAWYNLVLSNPETQERNILGNLLNFTKDLTHHAAAAVAGQRHKLTGNVSADRISFRELEYRIWGSLASVGKAFRNAGQAFQLGSPLDMQGRGISGVVYSGRQGAGALNRASRVAATLPEVFTRSLAAADEFFRTVTSLSDMYGMATRAAVKEGVPRGQDLFDHVDDLMLNPTKEMLAHAREYGLRQRFQDPSGIFARQMAAMTKPTLTDTFVQRGLKTAVRFFAFPFVRTPSSIVRTLYRDTVLGALESKNLRDIRAGGAERDLALSRMAVGSAVAGYMATWVANDEATGEGPSDPHRRQEWLLTHQPNSVRVGGKWYSYQGLGPMAGLLSAVATSAERLHELPDEASIYQQTGRVSLGVADALMDNGWMSNVRDLFRTMSGSEGERGAAFQRMLANQASVVVPAVVRAINQQYVDTTLRDSHGTDILDESLNHIRAATPGLSDSLPAQHDAAGNVMEREDQPGPDILNPFTQRTPSADPVVAEVTRLTQNGQHPLLTAPGKSLNVDDVRRTLTPEEFQRYQENSGHRAVEEIRAAMASPDWARMSDDDKREEIHSIVEGARADARDELFSGTPATAPQTPSQDGWEYEGTSPTPAAVSAPEGASEAGWEYGGHPGQPVASAASVLRGIFPGIHINQEHRDPNSRLGRANPGSWHNAGTSAADVRPIRGMTFAEYIHRIQAAGYAILESKDEVNHPSRHATGPHWHVVLGERT